jgi:DinB superfamily
MEPALSRLSPKRRDMHPRMMEIVTGFSLPEALALLIRTPATLSALLRGLPDMWVRRNEGRDTWSAFDIMGHLIVGERTDWMPRLRIILEKGEARQFDPFDRLAQFEESQGKSLDQLLDDFARLRRENLAALQTLNLQHEDWTRRGKHPSLGVVTLSETRGDMGRSRPHSPPSVISRDGPPVSQSSRAMERLAGRAAVCWS